ncbi:MAG: HAD family hydrolase, partial [Dechloromonas sp.]|nr:HAD family hydrolase [Dechloromonas sp.]
MQRIKALIFDVDGTLAETERDGHRPAFNAAFAECGLDWHWDEVLYGELLAITGGKERMRHYAERYAPDIAARPDLDALIKQVHAAKTAHYVRLVGEGRLPLRPGVAELIAEARAAGIRLAIATTTSPENVTALLDASLAPGSSDWFAVIGAGDVVA